MAPWGSDTRAACPPETGQDAAQFAGATLRLLLALTGQAQSCPDTATVRVRAYRFDRQKHQSGNCDRAEVSNHYALQPHGSKPYNLDARRRQHLRGISHFAEEVCARATPKRGCMLGVISKVLIHPGFEGSYQKIL